MLYTHWPCQGETVPASEMIFVSSTFGWEHFSNSFSFALLICTVERRWDGMQAPAQLRGGGGAPERAALARRPRPAGWQCSLPARRAVKWADAGARQV